MRDISTYVFCSRFQVPRELREFALTFNTASELYNALLHKKPNLSHAWEWAFYIADFRRTMSLQERAELAVACSSAVSSKITHWACFRARQQTESFVLGKITADRLRAAYAASAAHCKTPADLAVSSDSPATAARYTLEALKADGPIACEEEMISQLKKLAAYGNLFTRPYHKTK